MKNILLSTLFIFLNSGSKVVAQEIFGDWIKKEVTYIDGVKLSDDDVIKYQFLRYSFEKRNKLFMSVKFDDKGTPLIFERSSNILNIRNSYGFIINSFLIEKLSNNELILIQKGNNGFNEESCLKYRFIPEKIYQNQLSFTPSDILYINESDTVYKASKKIHPKFIGDKSFYNFCSDRISERDAVMSSNNLFISTFIITKNGEIKNIQVLENINKRFEKQFLKALNKSKKLWSPAELNGKKVDVQMTIEFRYISSNNFLPMYEFEKKGKTALNNNDFLKALKYFEFALEKSPNNIEIIYLKAICEINLGNKDAACESLKKVKASGEVDVNDLIIKNCK
ncbi:MAG: energy transducer TonB [Bacteroidales bacterium]|jgi:tetratricopeptide (TPR) repeat protein|nr:energy transducer TonB [Bacteroidales bacterium]